MGPSNDGMDEYIGIGGMSPDHAVAAAGRVEHSAGRMDEYIQLGARGASVRAAPASATRPQRPSGPAPTTTAVFTSAPVEVRGRGLDEYLQL